jgi:hypothetical protein
MAHAAYAAGNNHVNNTSRWRHRLGHQTIMDRLVRVMFDIEEFVQTKTPEKLSLPLLLHPESGIDTCDASILTLYSSSSGQTGKRSDVTGLRHDTAEPLTFLWVAPPSAPSRAREQSTAGAIFLLRAMGLLPGCMRNAPRQARQRPGATEATPSSAAYSQSGKVLALTP